MKKRTIVSTLIAVFILAVLPLQHSCEVTESDNVSTGEDSIIEEGIETAVDADEETATPETNGEGVVEMPTEGATMQEIIDRRYYLEQLLNDNYEVFSRIVNFFEEDLGEYYCRVEDGEIVVLYNELSPTGVASPHKPIKLSEVEVGEEIAYVINELGLVTVSADRYYVWFEMISDAPRQKGVPYSQGLTYDKSTAPERTRPDDFESDYGAEDESVRIRDTWFRYVNYAWNDLID